MTYTRLATRIASPVLAITLVFTAAYSPLASVEKAHAFPAFETNPAVVGGVVATAANQTIQTTIMQALNGLAWSVAKMTVQSITRSTVNWINSGFKGSPAFVSDLEENLKYLGDAVADDFFAHLDAETKSLTGFNITSPFQDQLNQKLREEYYRTTGSWGLNYTLYQQSTDPKAFINGDFSKGGFNAYISASQNPANNPFGAYTLASNQLWSQIDKAAQKRKSELDWGKGFLPWRGNCNTPTATSASNLSAVHEGLQNPTNPTALHEGTHAVSLSKKETCLFNAVRTPGSVIEAQLEHSLGSGIRQLELADSINEIVGALMGQLVNQVLGAGGLLGTSQPSSGGGSSYVDQATNSAQFKDQVTSMANGVQQSITNDRANITKFAAQWQKVLTAAEEVQQTCGSRGSRAEVEGVITRAKAAIAKADGALKANAAISAEITTATQSTAADQSTRITTAVTSYQSYLSSTAVPSPTEYAEAAFESSDTSDKDEDDSSEHSLYTKMQLMRRTCVFF